MLLSCGCSSLSLPQFGVWHGGFLQLKTYASGLRQFHTSFGLVGKCIHFTRDGGIFQEHMNEGLERLNEREWLHTFPEGKVSQEGAPIKRLKWGTAGLIDRAPITPIVLRIFQHGIHEVMPEKFFGAKVLLFFYGIKGLTQSFMTLLSDEADGSCGLS